MEELRFRRESLFDEYGEEVPENRRFDARVAWKSRLDRVLDSLMVEKRGHCVFIVGDELSDRSAMLEAVRKRIVALESQPLVVADDCRRDFSEARTWLTPLLKALGIEVAPLALRLIARLASISVDVGDALRSGAKQGPEKLERLFVRALDVGSRGRPVALLLSDPDYLEGTAWADFLYRFGKLTDEKPLLLVATLCGPPHPGKSSTALKSDPLDVAKSLVRKGRAEWWSLGDLSVEQLKEQFAVTRELATILHQLSGGGELVVASLLREWKRSGLVLEKNDHFVPSRALLTEPPRVLTDLLAARVRSLLGARTLQAIDTDLRLLAIAARAGAPFSLEAVALSMGEKTPEVRRRLQRLAGSDSEHAGIVCAAGHETICDRRGVVVRQLELWSFASSFLQLAAQGLTGKSVAKACEILARNLESLYAPQESKIGRTLVALWSEVGNEGKAAEWRRRVNFGFIGEEMERRANALLRDLPPDDWWSERRPEVKRELQQLLALCQSMIGATPPEAVRPFVETALHCARIARAHAEIVEALELSALLNRLDGRKIDSVENLEEALALARGLGDKQAELGLLQKRAWFTQAEGDGTSTITILRALVLVASEIGDAHGERAADLAMAAVYSSRGEFDAAASLLREVESTKDDLPAAMILDVCLKQSDLLQKQAAFAVTGESERMRLLEEALGYASKAIDTAGEMQNFRQRADALVVRAGALMRAKRHREALKDCEEAVELLDRLRDAYSLPQALTRWAAAKLNAGERQAVVEPLARAIAGAQALGLPGPEGEAFATLGRLALVANDWALTVRLGGIAVHIWGRTGHLPQAAQAIQNYFAIAQDLGGLARPMIERICSTAIAHYSIDRGQGVIRDVTSSPIIREYLAGGTPRWLVT